jgi:5,5'-dehydrodivanillate O-demethylase
MLTREQNESLTQVGPGTPGGELLRRYWHPTVPAAELTPERPVKRVRLLGEDLVLYRTESGAYGLLGEHCSHRGTSLAYGFLEGETLRCPYHGWLYDPNGHCVEQPFEPAQSLMKHTLKHPAYPAQRIAGLIWAYLGPHPAPLLPRWDVTAREDGTRHIDVQDMLECNWLQCQENSLDPTHVYYLHGQQMVARGIRTKNQYRPIANYEFERIPEGIRKRRTFEGDGLNSYVEPGHPAVFPNILRHDMEGRDGVNPHDGTMPIDMHFRIPVDDTHTQVIWLGFTPSPDGSWDDPYTQVPSLEYGRSHKDENGEFHVATFPSQDGMAWVTQGPVWDRTRERLGAGDLGIAMWRELLAEQIAIVQAGGDPINVYRDPEANQLIEFSPARVKIGDRYVPRASEAARAWRAELPGNAHEHTNLSPHRSRLMART